MKKLIFSLLAILLIVGNVIWGQDKLTSEHSLTKANHDYTCIYKSEVYTLGSIIKVDGTQIQCKLINITAQRSNRANNLSTDKWITSWVKL